MRSNHVVRSLIMIVVLSSLMALLMTSVMAIEISSPTEGRLVRDQVRIVIPKSSLDPGVLRSGFISIEVDGRFVAAVNASVASVDSKAPASPNVVYIWDSKALINDPLLPADQRNYRDGRHEIVVEAHSLGGKSKDVVADTAKVSVNLQNQVQRPNPAPPISLKYRFVVAQQNNYKISTKGEILDSTGFSLTGGQFPVVGEFGILQAVEDIENDGSALMRYKVLKDEAYTQVFGQITLLGLMRFNSIYKIVDNSGKIIEENVLSGKAKTEITDCLIRLPRKPIQVGESWPTEYHLKLEGLSDNIVFVGSSKLEGLEWEGGFECAKIVTKMSGSPMFYFISSPGKITATNTAYFAYKSGKLIKDVTVIEFDALLDNAQLAALQSQVPNPGGGGLGTSGMMPTSGSRGVPSAPAQPSRLRTPGSLSGSTSSYPSAGSPTSNMGPVSTNTAIKIRLVITKALQNS